MPDEEQQAVGGFLITTPTNLMIIYNDNETTMVDLSKNESSRFLFTIQSEIASWKPPLMPPGNAGIIRYNQTRATLFFGYGATMKQWVDFPDKPQQRGIPSGLLVHNVYGVSDRMAFLLDDRIRITHFFPFDTIYDYMIDQSGSNSEMTPVGLTSLSHRSHIFLMALFVHNDTLSEISARLIDAGADSPTDIWVNSDLAEKGMFISESIVDEKNRIIYCYGVPTIVALSLHDGKMLWTNNMTDWNDPELAIQHQLVVVSSGLVMVKVNATGTFAQLIDPEGQHLWVKRIQTEFKFSGYMTVFSDASDSIFIASMLTPEKTPSKVVLIGLRSNDGHQFMHYEYQSNVISIIPFGIPGQSACTAIKTDSRILGLCDPQM
jgi:hypothetical protein